MWYISVEPGNKQDNCRKCTKKNTEEHDKPHVPEGPFEDILNDMLVSRSLFAF